MSERKVIAKFRLASIAEVYWSKEAKELRFDAVYDTTTPENERFSKATPSGTCTMTCTNSEALAAFELGKFYYFNISQAAE